MNVVQNFYETNFPQILKITVNAIATYNLQYLVKSTWFINKKSKNPVLKIFLVATVLI